MASQTWETISSSVQSSIHAAIPKEYILSAKDLDPAITDKTPIPRTCGLLTQKQLDITETIAVVRSFNIIERQFSWRSLGGCLIERLHNHHFLVISSFLSVSYILLPTACYNFVSYSCSRYQDLISQLRSGTLSSVEVTTAFLARACIAHQLVNCLAGLFPAEALAQAKALDDHLARTGEVVGPLHGLPVGLKVCISERS